MATYAAIQEDVLRRYGPYTKTCWIAHVKEINGMPLRQAPNRRPGSERKYPCPDWARPLIEDSMRRFGIALMSHVNWEASKKIAKLVNAESGTCVVNVARAFRHFRSHLPEDAVYVEGLWKVGGQLHLHTWIEASDAIIDPTLVCETNKLLRDTTTHHPIDRWSEDKVASRFEGESLDPGDRLEMELSWDDPRVDELVQRIDPP